MPISNETIYALATPPGRSGVAVVRVSGPHVEATMAALELGVLPPRHAMLTSIRHPVSREVIDRGLVLYFPAPHSFTGEAMLELQLHGSRAVLAELFEALGTLPHHRPAEPGEFSRRAFLEGKLDLSAVEGLADLIDAETAAQKKQAMRQMEGALSKVAIRLRDGLLHSLASLEAFIDFPDEDLPIGIWRDTEQKIVDTRTEIARWLAGSTTSEQLRDGWYVTLLGSPNAGKSTLLNQLAARDAAIVSPEAGTTRDIVEVKLDLAGWPVILCDTAGLRETAGAVEKEGIRRALARSDTSELRILVLDSTQSLSGQQEVLSRQRPSDIVVVNKVDLPAHSRFSAPQDGLSISAHTGTGLDKLLERLRGHFDRLEEKIESSILSRSRHRLLFSDALEQIDLSLAVNAIELRTEHLRLAAAALSSIMGQLTREDLLDAIFSQFCLGK